MTTSTGTLAASNPWTYATGYTDTTTGYLKLGARYYNPTTGRFTQPDPIAVWGSYTYAGDNPANNTDPSGLDDVTYANQGTASSPPYDGGDSPIGSTECKVYVGTGSVLIATLGTPISSYGVNAVFNGVLYGAGFAAGSAWC